MECKEAERLVQAYIRNEIPPRKLEEFIEHVNQCPSCYDELETYYTIYFAIKYLDEDKHTSYNIKNMLNENMKKKLAQVKRQRRQKAALVVSLIILFAVLAVSVLILVAPFDLNEILSVFSGMLE